MGREDKVEASIREMWAINHETQLKLLLIFKTEGWDALIAELTRMTKEESEIRKYEPAIVLGKIGVPYALSLLIEVWRDQRYGESWNCLAGERIGGLMRTHRESEYHIEEAVVGIGEAAVFPLIGLLGHEDENVAVLAGRCLGRIGDAIAAEPLKAALNDKREDVRVAAAEALGKIGGVDSIEPLLHALVKAEKYSRREIVNALVAVGEKEVKLLFEAGRKKEFVGIRREIGEIVGRINKNMNEGRRRGKTQEFGIVEKTPDLNRDELKRMAFPLRNGEAGLPARTNTNRMPVSRA